MPLAEVELRTIAENIRSRRKSLGMTQESLADALDVSSNYISMIETGKEQPSLPLFFRMCRELQSSPNDISGFAP